MYHVLLDFFLEGVIYVTVEMLCVSILASHLTDLFKTWLTRRSNSNFKIRNILLQWSGNKLLTNWDFTTFL